MSAVASHALAAALGLAALEAVARVFLWTALTAWLLTGLSIAVCWLADRGPPIGARGRIGGQPVGAAAVAAGQGAALPDSGAEAASAAAMSRTDIQPVRDIARDATSAPPVPCLPPS
jgi:hypothetical protein